MSGSRDRDTAELLDELEATLRALREELDATDDGRRRRRPPTPVELLRFTERHTIPTVVAALEAAIEALDLLGAFLRLLDPDRSTERGKRDRGRAGESVVAGTERVLADLRRSLAAADLPEDPTARRLMTDARDLSEEVEARLREARGGPDAPGAGADESESGVGIDVTTERGESGEERERGGGDGVEGDVDAELESIRDEVRGDQDETAR